MRRQKEHYSMKTFPLVTGTPRLTGTLCMLALLFGQLSPSAYASGALNVWVPTSKSLRWVTDLASSFDGTSIKVTSFETSAALQSALDKTTDDSSHPDVVLGPYTLALHTSASKYLTAAYCADEECIRQCQKHPRPWCEYAQGLDYNEHSIVEFTLPRYCSGGLCPGCDGPEPLPCCSLKKIAYDRQPSMDLFQVIYSRWLDDRFLPIGIPIGWQRLERDEVPDASTHGSASDLTPVIYIYGAYLDSRSKNKYSALEFMYRLFDSQNQIRLYETTGLFPANAEAFDKVVSGTVRAGLFSSLTDPQGGVPACTACGVVVTDG